jgi:integrase
MRAIDGFAGSPIVKAALLLGVYTFVRPGELRQAEWAEVDLDKAEWKIPAAKMKMRRPHIVPLSIQSKHVLRSIHILTGQERYVFPSMRTTERPISENTVNAALRRMGYAKEELTGHGFRSMASTILNEQGWPPDAIERQLAHLDRDPVRAAYNYAELLDVRRKMMGHWANWLDEQKGK